MSAHYDVLIVGGGHGGAQAAIALRQRKFAGSIAIISDEPDPPYERPPLSKDYLARHKSLERILIRPADFWTERDIALLLCRRVTEVDPVRHTVGIADGTKLEYRTLIWATGGRPRRLTCSGHSLTGVHSVRNRADVDQIIAELDHVIRVVVIGGGYIGLEAAAILIELGKRVTIIEAQDRVLARVAGEPLSRFYEAEHRAHGVDVRLGVSVACIEERDGVACGVRLADGEVLECEMVIVGIGIIPVVEPLLAAGAEGSYGVNVDAFCRTSLPDVYAVGDCAAHSNAFADGATIRLESVQNANDMAVTVAKTITGVAEPYDTVPWFWSTQYDLKLQTVGLSTGFDEAVIRGEASARSFSIIYLKQGRIIALDCVNAAKDYVHGRALVVVGASYPPAVLANSGIALKAMSEVSSY